MGVFGSGEVKPGLVNIFNGPTSKEEEKKESAPAKGPFDGVFDEYIPTAKKYVMIGVALCATYYFASTFYHFGVQRALHKARGMGLNVQELEKNSDKGFIDSTVDRLEESLGHAADRVEFFVSKAGLAYLTFDLAKATMLNEQ